MQDQYEKLNHHYVSLYYYYFYLLYQADIVQYKNQQMFMQIFYEYLIVEYWNFNNIVIIDSLNIMVFHL